MEAKLIKQGTLIVVLASLLSMKFAVLPLIEWQGSAIGRLEASNRQLGKVQTVIANHPLYKEDLSLVLAEVKASNEFMYADADGTKLSIQRDLDELFSQDGIKVTGFNWVLDSVESSSSIRVLRVTVYFSGSTESMIRVFWNISSFSKIIKIVDWRQQMKRFGADLLGGTNGNVTLEFFASKRSAAIYGQQLGGIGD